MIGAFAMIVMSIIVTVVLAVFAFQFALLGLVCLLVAMIGSFGRFLRWRTTEFVLTSDRLVVRQGILSKAGTEIPLDRVTNISFKQTLWERMLGTGDLIVESAGESGHQFFTDVAQPSHVQNLIYRQTELSAHSSDDGAGARHGSKQQLSIPEQIEKLAELRGRGIISDAEFEQKKAELLGRM